MALFEVALDDAPYNFTTQLSADGSIWTLRFTYIARSDRYSLDILDSESQPVLSGLECAAYEQLNRRILSRMRGSLFFLSDKPSESYATRFTLGRSFKLYYQTFEEA